MENNFILFEKVYTFLRWLYPLIRRIPKTHQPVLGRQLEELALRILLVIIKANRTIGTERHCLQKQISDDLDCLRILIRLSKDLRFVSIKQYTYAAEKVNEIGRMLGGWMKSV